VSLVHRAGDWMRRRLIEPPPPLLAVEVRQRSVGVVRLVRERGRLTLAAAAAPHLPGGVLRPSLTQINILNPIAFRQALRSALERAGVMGGGRAALVLPDPVARLALVPAAELKARSARETDELLRFRLKKTVPFEIREARLAWMRAGTRAGDPLLVAAARSAVLDEYESACRDVGLEPGVVELAVLALASAAFAGASAEDRLLVNWDEGYVSLLLARGEWPLLVRTLADEAAADPAQVAREVSNTLLYHAERLGGAPLSAVAVRSAAVPIEDAIAILREAAGVEPRIVDPWPGFAAEGGGWGIPMVAAASSLARAA
jgi:hypothetical protein